MAHRRRRRWLVVTAVLAMLVAALPAAAVEEVQTTRVFGVDRIDTAAQIARLSFPDGVSTAVVTTSETFQDALAGAGLAGVLGAAQLLTRPDELPAATRLALADLGVQRVVIVGNEAGVSDAVSDEIAADHEVTRIAGVRAEETAAAVAGRLVNLAGGYPVVSGDRTVFLASVEGFADSLAGSSPAYAAQVPLLYTDRERLSPATEEFLRAEPVERVVVLGGAGAVSAAVEVAVTALGITVERLAGPTRVETALRVADFAADRLGFDYGSFLVARGDDFPDALAAAQLGGTTGDVIVLTATPGLVPESVVDFIEVRCPAITAVRGVGGEAALSPGALAAVEAAAESCAFGGDAEEVYAFDLFEQEAPAPQPLGVALTGRTDGQPFTGPVELGLLPCGNVTITDDDADVFADVDDDRAADGYGSSDTGLARILFVEGGDVGQATVVQDAVPGADGDIDVTVGAGGADCVVLVAVEGVGDGILTLGSLGTSFERYGLAVLRFTPAA